MSLSELVGSKSVKTKTMFIAYPDVFAAEINQGENLSKDQELCLSQMMSSERQSEKC